MEQTETHNLQQIEDLNQRGGRTLSIVDLIEANTVGLEMAAYLLWRVSRGASFLTAARPGGAGKTTLMACLLSFLPPGTRIVTVSDSSVLQARPADPRNPLCYLAHEIGSGHYYGYIWGEEAARFFELAQEGHRLASCLHADTLPELTTILTGHLDVQAAALAQVDLVLFMHVASGCRRRAALVYESVQKPRGEREHRLIYERDADSDTFVSHERAGVDAKEIAAAEEFLRRLRREGVREFAQVRREIVGFLRR